METLKVGELKRKFSVNQEH